MIVEQSDEPPRRTLLKRSPVPANFKVAPESWLAKGRTWPAPAGATQVKAFDVYRYDPETPGNPRIDTFEVDLDDCGPMVPDALFWIKGNGRSDARVPPFLPRGRLRIARHETTSILISGSQRSSWFVWAVSRSQPLACWRCF